MNDPLFALASSAKSHYSYGPPIIYVFKTKNSSSGKKLSYLSLESFITGKLLETNNDDDENTGAEEIGIETENISSEAPPILEVGEEINEELRFRIHQIALRVRLKCKMRAKTNLSSEERLKLEASFYFRHRHDLISLYSNRIISNITQLISEKTTIKKCISLAEKPSFSKFQYFGYTIEEIIETLYARMELVEQIVERYSPPKCLELCSDFSSPDDMEKAIIKWAADIPSVDSKIAHICSALQNI